MPDETRIQAPQIEVSQLYFKIEMIRKIYEILWGKDKDGINHLDKNVCNTISYAMIHAFFSNLNEVYAPEKSQSSGTTLYKLMKFMEQYKDSQPADIARCIELMIEEYDKPIIVDKTIKQKSIKSIVESRLKPFRNKIVEHLDEESNEKLVEELKNLASDKIDYNYPKRLMEFAENVVKLAKFIEANTNTAQQG